MTETHITRTSIEGVVLIERPVFGDERGFFHEIERRAELEAMICHTSQHAQWNHSRSRKSVLRGIHVAQWNKCVYVVRGNAQIAVCDLRTDSETFGQHVSFVIGERRRAAVFVPAGCGNSFLALDRLVDYMYSVDAAWYAAGEFGIAWNDPDLAIDWKVKQPLVSERDQHNPTLRERFSEWFEGTSWWDDTGGTWRSFGRPTSRRPTSSCWATSAAWRSSRWGDAYWSQAGLGSSAARSCGITCGTTPTIISSCSTG